MMKKAIFFILAQLILINSGNATVYEVVDGDSLSADKQKIRLDGIDAPEFAQICFDAEGKEYSCGLKALQYLKSLTENSSVRCDCLPEHDIYERKICECFADEISLNRAMVFAGYAMTYRSEKYAEAEQSAKTAKRGIWQGKFMRPALFRALKRVQNGNNKTAEIQ